MERTADHFFRGDRLHAAKIDRAFPQEARAALDVMPDDEVAISERSGQAIFGGTKDRDDRHAEQRGQVHRAGVVRQEQAAFAQLRDEIIERRLPDAVDALLAQDYRR